MRKKSGFTLVEMLIVIVIIGILSSALLPRLSGYMARTRDTKRQMDLKNVAAAIQMYWNNQGKLPLRKISNEDLLLIEKGSNGHSKVEITNYLSYYGALQELSGSLLNYLSSIPEDPQKNSRINIYYDAKFSTEFRKVMNNIAIKKGQYAYQIYKKNGTEAGGALLIAKVETPDAANYVTIHDGKSSLGTAGFEGVYFDFVHHRNDINKLHLCNSIIKTKKEEEFYTIDGNNTQCGYSSSDQLYYIVKIE